MADKNLNLLADFPVVSNEEWMEAVNKDLKGADFSKRLVWRTNEGFEVQPFYRADDVDNLKAQNVKPAQFPYVRSTKPNNDWLVRQDIKVLDAKVANKKALDLLQKGVTSLGFDLNGVQEVTKEFIDDLLSGIVPTAVELNFDLCVSKAPGLAILLTNYFKENGYYDDPTLLVGSIDVDPLNRILKGGVDLNEEFVLNITKKIIEAAAGLPFYRVVGVNSSTLNDAGAYAAQELGYALAWGNHYLSSLIEAGVDKSLAAKKIKFNFGVGSNYFMEIAKFRAARMLWAQIVMAYQPICHRECTNNLPDGLCRCAAKMRSHAVTSKFNQTIFDANVNMLRTQTEAMSASIAGVDSLTVLPYDVSFRNPDEFSERIARNQQLLLKEESHFDKIIDPSAGSYYIETLTNELAKQAWEIFLNVEEKGGFFAMVKANEVQKDIQASAAKRLKAVSSRREVLLGTNQFPNFTEKAIEKVDQEKLDAVEGCCGDSNSPVIALRPVRASSEFEKLRFDTEKAAKTPKVFMLTIGNLAMRLARAQFSSNFFACAGYEIIDNLGFKTIAEGVEAAKKADADVVVLCSSDDEYVEFAPEAYELSKGFAQFVVAGAPACMDELKEKGIEHFINVRSNVLETLQGFNALLLK